MRTAAEIRETGAAWITESELEWLCEQFETLRTASQALIDSTAQFRSRELDAARTRVRDLLITPATKRRNE